MPTFDNCNRIGANQDNVQKDRPSPAVHGHIKCKEQGIVPMRAKKMIDKVKNAYEDVDTVSRLKAS